MNETQRNNAIRVNIVFWLTAILLPFVMRLIPTSSGLPPRIFDVIIPMLQAGMAYASTRHLIEFISAASQGNNPATSQPPQP